MTAQPVKTILDPISSCDWEQAFAYASGVSVSGDSATPEVACPGLTTSTDPFTREDVAILLGVADGDNDGPDWICFGKLHDGRYFSLAAGCDYTGWDCVANGRSAVADTEDQILHFGLTDEERQRMHIELLSFPPEVKFAGRRHHKT